MHELLGVQLHALEVGIAAMRRSLADHAAGELPSFATAPASRPATPPARAWAVAPPNTAAPRVAAGAPPPGGPDRSVGAASKPPLVKRLSRRRLLLAGGAAAGATTALAVTAGPEPAAAQAAPTASGVSFTPTGAIGATNVQSALAEVDAEKAPRANPGFSGTATFYAAATQIRPWVDVRAFGAKGDGTADDTNSLVFAIFVAAAHNGGTVLVPPGRYRISSEIVVPDGVDLWGCGGHQQTSSASGTMIEAASAGARLVFEGVAGQSGNFGINGAHVAAPDRGLLAVDAVERTFTALRVCGSTTDGAVIERAQNCTFNQLMVADCERDGLVLDDGAGNNSFIRCEFSACGRDNVSIRSSGDTSSPFRGTPTGNNFLHCISERGLWQNGGWNGPNNSMLNVTGGMLNRFSDCVFAVQQPNTSTSGWLVLLFGGLTAFRDCQFSSDLVNGLRNLGAGAEFHGVNHFMCTGTAIDWNDFADNAWGRVLGTFDYGADVVTRWTGNGAQRRVTFGTDRPHHLRVDDDANYALRTQRAGEPNGFRFQVTTLGELQVANGASYTPAATWRLQSDGSGWETPNDVHINGGSLSLQETGTTPALPAASNRAALYVHNDRLVVAFNDAGTVRYKSLLLSGAGAVWTDSTTPP